MQNDFEELQQIKEHENSDYYYFEEHKEQIKYFLRNITETPYGKKNKISDINIDNLSLEDWNSVPLLTPKNYQRALDFVRHDENHLIDEMVILFSGGTTGKSKETYFIKDDIKIALSSIMEQKIRNTNFVFLSEAKQTISNRTIKETAEKLSNNISFKGFDTVEEFVNICNNSTGDIFLTLQVSSCRRLLSKLKNFFITYPEKVEQLKKINNLYIDLVAEPIQIKEIEEIYNFFKKFFSVNWNIAIPYSSSEQKLIGLYKYIEGDEKICYEVVESKLVECLDPVTHKPTNKKGDIVVTDFKKEFGSLYPRYETGDRAEIIYKNGKCYIGEVDRDPEKGQINIRGNKIYSGTMWSAIQKEVGNEIPITMRFQVLENNDRSESVLNIEVYLASDICDEKKTEQVKKAISNFMNKEYKFLCQDGQEIKAGEIYKTADISIEFSYNYSDKDGQKPYQIMAPASLEKFRQDNFECLVSEILEEFYNKREKMDGREIFLLWSKLLDLIKDEKYSQISPEFYETKKWLILKEKIRKFSYEFEIQDEKSLFELSKQSNNFDKIEELLKKTCELAIIEVKALLLNKNSSVCFVGGGSIPTSAIKYSKMGVGHIHVIETDPESAINARNFIKSSGIKNITVETINGLEADYSQYDIVIIAAMVNDKDELAMKIKDNFGKPVLIRAPISKLAEAIYSPSGIKATKVIDYGNRLIIGKLFNNLLL